MKSVYLNIRVDVDTDSQEEADQLALTLRLIDERNIINMRRLDGIHILGFTDKTE